MLTFEEILLSFSRLELVLLVWMDYEACTVGDPNWSLWRGRTSKSSLIWGRHARILVTASGLGNPMDQICCKVGAPIPARVPIILDFGECVLHMLHVDS